MDLQQHSKITRRVTHCVTQVYVCYLITQCKHTPGCVIECVFSVCVINVLSHRVYYIQKLRFRRDYQIQTRLSDSNVTYNCMQTSAAAKLQLATKVEASGRRHTRSHSFMQAQTRSSMHTVLVADCKARTKQMHKTNAQNKRTMRHTLARSDAGVAHDERAASASRSSSSTRSLRMSSRQRSLPLHDDLDRCPRGSCSSRMHAASNGSACSGGITCGVGGRSTGFV